METKWSFQKIYIEYLNIKEDKKKYKKEEVKKPQEKLYVKMK